MRIHHISANKTVIFQVPKKNLSDLIIRVEGKDNTACSIPLPIPDPIRKKPQPRKLKNL